MKRAKRISQGILKEKIDVNWNVQGIRIDTVTKMNNDYLKLLEKSGCIRLTFGVESASTRIQKFIRKNINISQVRILNKKLRKFDFR